MVHPQDGSYVHKAVLLYYSLREGKHSSVDVTPILGANHVKILCSVIDLHIVFICCIYLIMLCNLLTVDV